MKKLISMNVFKRIAVCAAICTVLGIGGKAYASWTTPKIILSGTDTVSKNVVMTDECARISEKSACSNNISLKTNLVVESTITVDEVAPLVETEANCFRWNMPSEGDEIHDEYFVHTYSNGQKACIPFDSEIERNYSNIPTRPIDVNALKELGSNEPLTNEISYEVVEFLDGTKRYFKLGKAPLAFTDPLRYGIYTYIEGGSGEYYSEVLPNGMTVCGWK